MSGKRAVEERLGSTQAVLDHLCAEVIAAAVSIRREARADGMYTLGDYSLLIKRLREIPEELSDAVRKARKAVCELAPEES